jgi:hypothetical protein
MLRNCYALLLAMLIVTTIAAKPQIVLDKDFSKTDQKTDFAGRGRLAIPLDTASDKPEFYRLDIESRDATRSPVFLSVRGATSPSKTYWSGSLDPNETWTQREFVFQLDPHSEHTSLLILAPQAGTLELRNIKITREGLDDLVERLKRDNPNGDRRRNLCRISRFPLGIQSGWAIDREHSDELMQVEADEKVIGPSGSPALKLSVADSMHTEVAPFSVPWPFINHTASLYVRGKGHLTMVVLADGRNIGATDCDVSGDEWKRISLKFMPAMLAETHQLQLLTSGTIWIDAMQVEPGETATDYDSAYPCEVSLTLPKSETSTPRIQFIDEPAQVTFAVTGKARPFRAAGSPILKSKVINLYGEEKNLPDIPLSDNFLSTGNIKYESKPGSKTPPAIASARTTRSSSRAFVAHDTGTRTRRNLHSGFTWARPRGTTCSPRRSGSTGLACTMRGAPTPAGRSSSRTRGSGHFVTTTLRAIERITSASSGCWAPPHRGQRACRKNRMGRNTGIAGTSRATSRIMRITQPSSRHDTRIRFGIGISGTSRGGSSGRSGMIRRKSPRARPTRPMNSRRCSRRGSRRSAPSIRT